MSSLRIALAPAMLGAAYSNAKVGFPILLATALATDVMDGLLARRWRAETELGRRLDWWGDGLTMAMGAAGVFFLWPQAVEQVWPWALVALGGYALVGLQRWITGVGRPVRRRWTGKLTGWAVPVALVPLIIGSAVWPFQVAAVLQALTGAWRVAGAIGRPSRGPQLPAEEHG